MKHDEDYFQKNLAMNVASRRKQLGLTQKDLADCIGRHLTSVSKLEREEAQPTFIQVAMMAQEMNCSLDWIAGFDVKNKPDDPFDSLPTLQKKIMKTIVKLLDKHQRDVLQYASWLLYKEQQRVIAKAENVKEGDQDETEDE